MPSQRIRELLIDQGYQGGKSITDDYVREARPLFLKAQKSLDGPSRSRSEPAQARSRNPNLPARRMTTPPAPEADQPLIGTNRDACGALSHRLMDVRGEAAHRRPSRNVFDLKRLRLDEDVVAAGLPSELPTVTENHLDASILPAGGEPRSQIIVSTPVAPLLKLIFSFASPPKRPGVPASP
jgi:hypothetical protein